MPPRPGLALYPSELSAIPGECPPSRESMSAYIKDRDREHGEYMYEHFEERVTYNLADAKAGGMLTYRIGKSSEAKG